MEETRRLAQMGERMGYPLLGHPTQHYMDYCGSSLYTSSQLKVRVNVPVAGTNRRGGERIYP